MDNNKETRYAQLKNNIFEYIKVTGDDEQFPLIKRFCKDDVTISFEEAPGIDFYWCITLFDHFQDKEVVVPNGDYIVKICGRFTVIDNLTFNKYFVTTDIIDPDKSYD